MRRTTHPGHPGARHNWGSRQVSPSEPVRASASDLESLRRFPHGYPHIVSFDDGTGADGYAVRIRRTDGMFEIVGDETSDPGTARSTLEGLISDLADAFRQAKEQDDWHRIREVQRALWAPDATARSYVWGIEDCIWPHMKWQDMDRDLLASLPEGCPTIQQYIAEDKSNLYNIGYKAGDQILLGDHRSERYINALFGLFDTMTIALCIWEWHMRPRPSHPLAFGGHRCGG